VRQQLLALTGEVAPYPQGQQTLARATQVALAFPGVELDQKGRVVVDKATYRTGNPKVYSGGDCVNGGKEVVNAAAEAKAAARAMDQVFKDGAK